MNKEKLGFPPTTQIFTNESLCRPFNFLYFHVRQAYKLKKIHSYNLWKGKITIKAQEDLIKLNLVDENKIEEFYKSY